MLGCQRTARSRVEGQESRASNLTLALVARLWTLDLPITGRGLKSRKKDSGVRIQGSGRGGKKGSECAGINRFGSPTSWIAGMFGCESFPAVPVSRLKRGGRRSIGG